ncbi:MAG: 16S rRNA (guanine(966)-N(2))-methyltransferase RsmD [Candidatus Electryonea clarkiae]|nr:16S rRNA (guanine(966)-N(2))-methyltransferase RsmD [Candidatus Electryonea clarkiae]MDP8285083.1 16S rRNA (guanine(966)-N(2))-methyltransferase RsmD [Candidatus Electryonea clarkiae]
MKLTGGMGKGKRLAVPAYLSRPTSAKVREVLFQLISDEIQDAKILDLFAGSGALGLEALARGASNAIFVEKHYKVTEIIKKNIQTCSFDDKAHVFKADVLSFLTRKSILNSPFHLIFADPPYKINFLEKICGILDKMRLLEQDGIFIYELSSREQLSVPENWTVYKEKIIGDTKLLFLKQNL